MWNHKSIATATLLAMFATGAAASPDEYERDDYYERRGPLPFEVLDLDRDGVVTAAEHAQVRQERREYRSERGYLMRNQAAAPDFTQIDSNGDDMVSREELDAWHSQRMQQRPAMGRGRGGRWDE